MRRRDKANRRQPRRLRTFSFVATLSLIVVLLGTSYYASLPKIEHLSNTIQFQSESWMDFVPRTAQYVGFVNYQEAYRVAENSMPFGTQAILQFYQLRLDITTQSIVFDLDIQLPSSVFNSAAVTGSVIKLHDDASSILMGSLNRANLTSISYDGFLIYRCLVLNPSAQQKLIDAYATLVTGSTLVVSTDERLGRYAVETILDQYSSKLPNFFDKPDVRRGVLAAGVVGHQYVALFVGAFASQISNSRMIIKSVIPMTQAISVIRSVEFDSAEVAMNQLAQARLIYRDAASYKILDQWVVISYNYSQDSLRGQLTGI